MQIPFQFSAHALKNIMIAVALQPLPSQDALVSTQLLQKVSAKQ